MRSITAAVCHAIYNRLGGIDNRLGGINGVIADRLINGRHVNHHVDGKIVDHVINGNDVDNILRTRGCIHERSKPAVWGFLLLRMTTCDSD
jgi:hypothetical protein